MSTTDGLQQTKRKTAFFLFFFVFISFSGLLCARQLTRQGDIVDSDGRGYFVHLPTFFVDGDIDYSNNLARFGLYQKNHWPIGTALSWTPAYLLGRSVSLIGEKLQIVSPQEGQGFAEQLACCLATVAYGSFTVGLAFLLLTRWFSLKVSLLSVVGLLFSGNLCYYLLCEPYMSHGVATFWVTVVLYVGLVKEPLTVKRAILMGLATGMTALTRPQDGLILLVPFVWLMARSRGKKIQVTGLFVVSGLVSLLLFSLQVYVWNNQKFWVPTDESVSVPAVSDPAQPFYGFVQEVPGGEHNWTSPKFSWALFNSQNGLWVWNPLTFFAFIGLLVTLKTRPKLAAALLTGFLALLYVVAAWSGQGQSFGSRMMCSAYALFAIGLASLCQRYSKTAPIVIALAVIFNLYLVIRYRQLVLSAPLTLNIWSVITGGLIW